MDKKTLVEMVEEFEDLSDYESAAVLDELRFWEEKGKKIREALDGRYKEADFGEAARLARLL